MIDALSKLLGKGLLYGAVIGGVATGSGQVNNMISNALPAEAQTQQASDSAIQLPGAEALGSLKAITDVFAGINQPSSSSGTRNSNASRYQYRQNNSGYSYNNGSGSFSSGSGIIRVGQFSGAIYSSSGPRRGRNGQTIPGKQYGYMPKQYIKPTMFTLRPDQIR